MILQILANPGQVMHHGYAHSLELRPVAYTGKEEDLRASKRPGTEEDFPLGLGLKGLASAGKRHPL